MECLILLKTKDRRLIVLADLWFMYWSRISESFMVKHVLLGHLGLFISLLGLLVKTDINILIPCHNGCDDDLAK